MDLFAYLLIILVIGVARVNTTKNVSDEVGVVSESIIATNVDMSEIEELPLAQNLALIKEPDAYKYILYDLGLEKPLC